MIEFTIVIEDAGSNFAAYAPDVQGCIATGAPVEEVTSTLREAIVEHLEILRKMGEEIPSPHSRAGVIQIVSSNQLRSI
jgi:predicted RNase H-like HicB family nuclease